MACNSRLMDGARHVIGCHLHRWIVLATSLCHLIQESVVVINPCDDAAGIIHQSLGYGGSARRERRREREEAAAAAAGGGGGRSRSLSMDGGAGVGGGRRALDAGRAWRTARHVIQRNLNPSL
jgi:hypothetical protein